MHSRPVSRLVATAALLAVGLWLPVSRARADGPKNLFSNASFELGRLGPWHLDKGEKASARLVVDAKDAFDGQRSALVAVDTAGRWGTQFGQSFEAGKRGGTYTFAVLAKAAAGRVTVDLRVERAARAWHNIERPIKAADLVVKSKAFELSADKWTELHVTFKAEQDFREGWFAYVGCGQAKCRYRVDMFRLCEGPYTPYRPVVPVEPPTPDVRLFDTMRPSAGPISGKAMSLKSGWTRVDEDTRKHAFKGDTVFMNDRIAVVLRRKGRGAELYGRRATGMTLRAVLAPDQGATACSRVKIVKNEQREVAVDATFEAGGGKTATVGYALKMGQVFVETAPRAGATALRVEAPCRFAVLPDFFADDIVADATQLPVDRAELPSEHFLLHMVGKGEAIVMSVWDVASHDVQVTLSGKGPTRRIDSSMITYGKKGKVWAAVLEAPGIWHTRNIAGSDMGKIISLDWRAPHAALWRIDWTRNDGFTGSWEMINERPDGRFTKHTWLGTSSILGGDRKRWMTVYGSFYYPCWIDRRGGGHIQPLKKGVRFEGPAVIYPIDRVQQTPLDRFAVVDIMRRTLGVGPCEYILDVENQRSRYKGRAACPTRDLLGRIYSKRVQKGHKAEIEKALDDLMVFFRHIRGRIESYVAFGKDLRSYLAARKKAHPELARHIVELEALTRAVDERVDRRRSKIKTLDHAAKTVEEFRSTLLTYEGADALAKVKKYTAAWVEIGGNQDEVVAECRLAVKRVRQRAGLLMAAEPGMAEIAREIRRRTQKVLRNPANHEGANH